jgi:release factor glutamine methyltransferase
MSLVKSGSTLAEVLRISPLPALENRILLSHALKLSRVQLITQNARALGSEEAAQVEALLARRISGEPIAYITGEREFYGLPFRVSPAVLIPRPETELLVELAIERLPENGQALDMGTGSGAIAVALAHARRDVHVTALDVSKAALAIAEVNAARHGVTVSFLQSDWYDALQSQKFELIVSNPPYIIDQDPHLFEGDLRFEPADALTDHADGLSAIRIIVGGAGSRLLPGGWLLLEHGYHQAVDVRALLNSHGFECIQSWQDLAGIERASGGRMPLQ